MSDDADSREMGIEFGDLAEKLDEHEYPASQEELVEEYGDEELQYPSGTRTFGEVLGGYQAEDSDFESAEEVRQAVFNMVGSDAVGEKGQTGRGVSSATENEDDQQESF